MLRSIEVSLLVSRQSAIRFSVVNHIFFPPSLYKAQIRTDPSDLREEDLIRVKGPLTPTLASYFQNIKWYPRTFTKNELVIRDKKGNLRREKNSLSFKVNSVFTFLSSRRCRSSQYGQAMIFLGQSLSKCFCRNRFWNFAPQSFWHRISAYSQFE